MTIRKAQVLSWQSEKHKSNTVNTYINTKKNFTHIHLLYKCTQTPAQSLTPSQAHERARTHSLTHTHTHTHKHTHTRTRTHTYTHTHSKTHHTPTHTNTHAQQIKKWRQQQALLLVPCFAVNGWDTEQFVRRWSKWSVGGVRGETVWEVRGHCTIKVAESPCR